MKREKAGIAKLGLVYYEKVLFEEKGVTEKGNGEFFNWGSRQGN